jgi:hypothetical protein
MDDKEIWIQWFEYAENDFEAAIIQSLQAKPKYEIICYHCQQEEKGTDLFIMTGKPFPRGSL